MKEHDSVVGFHARLSWLADYYGRPAFEAKLLEITRKYFPKTTVIEVSPYFFEKVTNMIDQARLKNSIALTIGLDSEAWYDFERQMKPVTLMGFNNGVVNKPWAKVAEKLMRTIAASKMPVSGGPVKNYDQIKAEAVARTVDMSTFVIRWMAFNDENLKARASASAKNLAIIGLGLVGVTVLAASYPLVPVIWAGAGAMGASLSSNVATAAILARVAQTAAGAGLGAVGAPGALVVTDSYKMLANAKVNSLNNQTQYACELSKTIKTWQEEAPNKYMWSSVTAAGLGAAGGVALTSTILAKGVLVTVGGAVATAQVKSGYDTYRATSSALSLYKLADQARERGDMTMAREYLVQARSYAIDGGNQAIEALIVGTLSYHIASHGLHAWRGGPSKIHEIWGTSADTMPSAGNIAVNMVPGRAALPALAEVKCEPGVPNYESCMNATSAMARN